MNNQQQQQQQFQQNMQVGTGLTRYRSAPSSYFASFLNSPTGDGGFGADDLEQLFNPRASSPESQRIFSRFLSGSDVVQENSSANFPISSQQQLNSQFLPPATVAKNEPQPLPQQQSNEYAPPSQMVYQSRISEVNSVDKASWGSFNTNTAAPAKMGRPGGGGSTLIRHSSSPAGLFANINIENEFGVIGSFGGGTGNRNNAETSSFSSGSRINTTQMDNFHSKHSASGMMDPISEIGENNPLNDDRGFSMNSWDGSAMLPDNFLSGLRDNDARTFSNAAAQDEQNNESGNRPTTLLSHHLSLPSNSAELEKLLQDSVPCKIRAKRGCATHPRSIAERVRRTKISERMRKLQELVPNMEKQTNTSDMLDLAVDYIKDLQNQVKKLNDNREKCSCSASEQR